MSNSTTPFTGSTSQPRPESGNYCFTAPRTEGAPYPPYSLKEAVARHLDGKRNADVPRELVAINDTLLGHVHASAEHTDAARTLAGLLYRKLEEEGSKSLSLARALCLILSQAQYATDMIEDGLREVIVTAFGEEVK